MHFYELWNILFCLFCIAYTHTQTIEPKMAGRKKKAQNVILHDTNTGSEIKEQENSRQQHNNIFEILIENAFVYRCVDHLKSVGVI